MTAKNPIINVEEWFDSPPGQYILAWEQAYFDCALEDVFGFHALQLGLPALNGLNKNRIQHRWLAHCLDSGRGHPAGRGRHALLTDFSQLPFEDASLDLVLMPHVLDFSKNPQAVLAETARVLVPEGRLALSVFNPWGLWGVRRPWMKSRLGQDTQGRPSDSDTVGQASFDDLDGAISYRRLRDWLALLGCELEEVHYGCYRPPVSTWSALERFKALEKWGSHWWPPLGGVLTIQATKRVPGMRSIGLAAGTARSLSSRLKWGAVTGSLPSSPSRVSNKPTGQR